MNEFITADEAVSKGQKWITFPVVLILVGGIFLSLYLVATNQISIKWFIIGFISSMTILPWTYWSLTIMIWKNWAFESVRNVHELKRKAIDGNLIYEDDSIVNKTIIAFPWQKSKWDSLKEKFNQKDIIIKELFIDDLTIDNETVIYFSKLKNTFYALCSSVFFLAGIGMFIEGKEYIWASIITIFGGYMTYDSLKQVLNNKPQIIINNNGIQTETTKFYDWSKIKNERIEIERTTKNIYHYLKYDCPSGKEEINLNELKINPDKLKRLLKIYRGRWSK